MDGGGALFSVTLRRTAQPVAEPQYRRALGRVVPKPNGRVEARKSPKRDRRAEPPRWCPFCVDRAGFVGLRLFINTSPVCQLRKLLGNRTIALRCRYLIPHRHRRGCVPDPAHQFLRGRARLGGRGCADMAKVMHAHPRLAHAGEPALTALVNAV
jgi:hypothetical protein